MQWDRPFPRIVALVPLCKKLFYAGKDLIRALNEIINLPRECRQDLLPALIGLTLVTVFIQFESEIHAYKHNEEFYDQVASSFKDFL